MIDPSTWNVVITDDEPDSVRIVQMVCEFNGGRVRSAQSGFECLELLRKECPGLLFLDIQMPHMSGWEVLKVIRADASLKPIVVIAMTAHAMEGDRQRVLAAGFDGYIPKPVSPLTFISEVKAILSAKQPQEQPSVLPQVLKEQKA